MAWERTNKRACSSPLGRTLQIQGQRGQALRGDQQAKRSRRKDSTGDTDAPCSPVSPMRAALIHRHRTQIIVAPEAP
jgi:hypothetical protein